MACALGRGADVFSEDAMSRQLPYPPQHTPAQPAQPPAGASAHLLPLAAWAVGAALLAAHVLAGPSSWKAWRSEEHTSELQSQSNLVCRLLLEKKKKKKTKDR